MTPLDKSQAAARALAAVLPPQPSESCFGSFDFTWSNVLSTTAVEKLASSFEGMTAVINGVSHVITSWTCVAETPGGGTTWEVTWQE